jgi:hypothetical protein
VEAFAAAITVFDALPDTAYLSANASAEVLMDASWVHSLVALGVPLERLVVEITEYTHIDEYDALIEAERPLRHRGVRGSRRGRHRGRLRVPEPVNKEIKRRTDVVGVFPDRGPRRVAGLRPPLPLRGFHGPHRRRTHRLPARRDHPGGRHHRTHRVIVGPDPPRNPHEPAVTPRGATSPWDQPCTTHSYPPLVSRVLLASFNSMVLDRRVAISGKEARARRL